MAKDNSKAGRSDERTVVTTNTVVEDRTDAPVEMARMEYHSEDRELVGGTVLTTYGEPLGGFPSAEDEAA